MKKKIILIIIAVVLVLGAIGGGVYFYYFKQASADISAPISLGPLAYREISILKMTNPDGNCLPKYAFNYDAYVFYFKDHPAEPYYLIRISQWKAQKSEIQGSKCKVIFNTSGEMHYYYYEFEKSTRSYKPIAAPDTSTTDSYQEIENSPLPNFGKYYIPLACCQNSPTPTPVLSPKTGSTATRTTAPSPTASSTATRASTSPSPSNPR